MRELIETMWLPGLEEFKPQMVFISAGFDAHREDDLGQLGLVEADYEWITRRIKDVADRHAQGRIVSCLEGGYNLGALARSVAAHLRVLADDLMQNLASLQQALRELTLSGALVEVAMLVASLAVAYAGVWLARGPQRPAHSIWYGARIFDGVFFPTLALLVGLAARWRAEGLGADRLLKLAIPILASLALIRVSAQVLHTAFPSSALVRGSSARCPGWSGSAWCCGSTGRAAAAGRGAWPGALAHRRRRRVAAGA